MRWGTKIIRVESMPKQSSPSLREKSFCAKKMREVCSIAVLRGKETELFEHLTHSKNIRVFIECVCGVRRRGLWSPARQVCVESAGGR